MSDDRLRRTRCVDAWILALAALAAAWLYFGTAMEPSIRWFSREPSGYYGLQTAGFQGGQLAAAIKPQPALLALKDPYDPVANAPYRVHDMTLYHRRYYLYFGATPILLIFWPCAALTGWYPSEPLVVALFCTGALWLGFALLGALRRRYFPAASSWVLAAGAACLMLANPLTHLVQGPMFYQVAAAAAIFLQLAMLAALYRSLHSERCAGLWLALASGLYGLDVGARPSYLPGGIAVLIAAGLLLRRAGRDVGLGRLTVLCAAAALPAAVCGAALMLYNWLRFGSVFEFGLRYQLAGENLLHLRPIQAGLIGPHLRSYLFGAGDWSDYFPFFAGAATQPYGFLRYVWWGWLAPCAFLPAARPGVAGDAAGRRFAFLLLAVVLGNLLLLASYFYTVERYACDYTCTWLLLSGIGGLALSDRGARRGWGAGAGALLGGLAGVSLLIGLATFASFAPRQGPWLALGRLANWPRAMWRQHHGGADGALRITLDLAPGSRSGVSEPIFETGQNPGQRDWLQLDYLPDRRARVSFHHAGLQNIAGDPFPLPGDGRLVIEARCGSLLPPFDHPAFTGWSRDDYEAAKRDLRVTVNEVERLRGMVYCFDTVPDDLVIGRLAWPAEGTEARFSGRVLKVVRVPPVRSPFQAPALSTRRPVELTLRLPAQHGQGGDPILITGHGSRSDLIYCRYEADGRIRFALDHFGGGGPQSEAISCDRSQPHRLTLWMGSLADASFALPSAAGPLPDAVLPWSHRLVVRFDGRTLINTEQAFYPGDPATALIGVNPYGLTTAGRQFEGRVERVSQVGFDTLPPSGLAGAYGAINLIVEFPWSAAGRHEPLVVSGVPGAADFLYVVYLDARHLAIGFDDWGTGGMVGPPIEVDYAQAHRLSLTMRSLYPPDARPEPRSPVRVTVDGRVALATQSPCHPSTPAQIRVGVNPIGGSTCGAVFNGRILSIERPRE
jgi:hypothetical protein